MKAIVLERPGQPELSELEDLVIDKDGWVKVAVRAVGLCGSDMQKINSPLDPSTYLSTKVLGHEFAGEIVEVSSHEDSFCVGDRVTAVPLVSCYACPSCEDGHYQLCANIESIGRTLRGAFSEQVLVPSKNLRRISSDLSCEEACLTDVFAVAVHTYHLADSPEGKRVLIIGDGAIGLSCLEVFKQKNVVDIIGKHQTEKVYSLGGKYAGASDLTHLPANSFDVVIETVGRRQDKTLNDAIRLIRPRGKIVVAGVYEPKYLGALDLRSLFYKETSVQGANSYGVWQGKNEFDQALGLIENGQVNASGLITHVLPLSEFSRGVELMNQKARSGAIKVVYQP